MNDIEITEQKIRKLAEELETERRRLKKLKSCEFIRVNDITLETLHRTKDFEQWFYQLSDFTTFLKTLPQQKPWTSWNTAIHRTSELMEGRWSNTEAYEDDVPPR